MKNLDNPVVPDMRRTSVMRRVSLRNLAAHKLRLALTVFSIMLGTSFVAGSMVFGVDLEMLSAAFFDNVAPGCRRRCHRPPTPSAPVSTTGLSTNYPRAK